jgi:hypothetical protein
MKRLRAVRSIAKSTKAAITAVLIVTAPAQRALASEGLTDDSRRLIAQSSLGGPEQLPPSIAPTPQPANPAAPSPSRPRTDYIPPNLEPKPAPNQPNSPSDIYWGAIGFTADGSYSSVWKMASQPEAEAQVLRQCARFGHGGCEVTTVSGQQCVGLATFIGNYQRRRWNLSFTAIGPTYPEAQSAAMARCNSDERSQGRCMSRTTACADGR